VRSIYRINQLVDGQKFDFWIDIVAEPWRIAEIVLEINVKANELEVEAGTRTMEVLKYYLSESVQGVHATDFGREIMLFLEETRTIDSEIANGWLPDEDGAELTNELLGLCSKGWYEQTEAVEDDSEEAIMLERKIGRFYAFLFWGNIAPRKVNAEHLRQAGAAWNDMYQSMERMFIEIVCEHLKCPKEAVWQSVQVRLKELGVPDGEVGKIRSAPVEQVFHFARRDRGFTYFKDINLSETMNLFKEGITLMRNATAHADQRVELLNVALPEGEQRIAMRDIVKFTGDLIDLSNLASDCLSELRRKT
jgi:hypothetical protein